MSTCWIILPGIEIRMTHLKLSSHSNYPFEVLAECLVGWGRMLLILLLLNCDRCFWLFLIFSFYYSIVQEMYVCKLRNAICYWYGRKHFLFRGWYDIMEEDLMTYSVFLCISKKLHVRFSNVSLRYSCSNTGKTEILKVYSLSIFILYSQWLFKLWGYQ